MKYVSFIFSMSASLALLVKAALEAWYFKDRNDAIQTLKYWAVIFGSLFWTFLFAVYADQF